MTTGPGITRVPLPKGFLAGGINCGVRKYRPDLGVLISQMDATAVGVYTQNECKSASIVYSQSLTPSQQIRAIVTNSGQANAATGQAGVETNAELARTTAHAVGCKPSQVLTASTGVIGAPLELSKILPSIPELVARATTTAEGFALAILTTDLVPKAVSTRIQLSTGEITITGICKGSGMIHPNMATMLGYVLTDAGISVDVAGSILKSAVDVSFNMISVDGDTSPNDCVFLLANGASRATVSSEEDVHLFRQAVTEVCQVLAKAIARDGEGCTKLIEVQLKHAPDCALAREAARSLTVSPLIKSAVHGADPNWGRILSRLGAAHVAASLLEKMTLRMQGTTLFDQGHPVSFDRETVRQLLKEDTIRIDIDLHSGDASATAWGCDLSKKYVEINAEYST